MRWELSITMLDPALSTERVLKKKCRNIQIALSELFKIFANEPFITSINLKRLQ